MRTVSRIGDRALLLVGVFDACAQVGVGGGGFMATALLGMGKSLTLAKVGSFSHLYIPAFACFSVTVHFV